MLDPQRRWAHVGEKPDYAGLLSFCGLPYTEDPEELAGVDVAIVGAPMDELVSERPGTRLGSAGDPGRQRDPRPASAGRHRSVRGAAGGGLRRRRRAPGRSGALARGDRSESVGQVLAAGALPLVLGGDHSIAEPDIRACAEVHGPVGLVHFDAHTDTAAECFGVVAVARDADVQPGAVRSRRPGPLRPDRAAGLLARRRGVRVAA